LFFRINTAKQTNHVTSGKLFEGLLTTLFAFLLNLMET